jgi:hypothetical protein
MRTSCLCGADGFARRANWKTCFVLAALTALPLASCTGASAPTGGPPECYDNAGRRYTPCRAFVGRLLLPHAAKLPLEAKAFQLMALGFAAKGAAPKSDAGAPADGGAAAPPPTTAVAPRLFFGAVFAHEEGAGLRAGVPFSVLVPCGVSINLLLQGPGGSSGAVPGRVIAPLEFDDGSGAATSTLIPRQPDDGCGDNSSFQAPPYTIDLGQASLVLSAKGQLASGAVTLGDKGSQNPLKLIDADADGMTAYSDTDDDGDGSPDQADVDADGDGITDAAQTYSAAQDKDADGIPDKLE